MRQMVDITIEESDQVFSYYDDKDGALRHLNASMLHRLRKQVPDAFEMFTLTLTDLEYNLCMLHRGIEEPRVAALKGKYLREPGYMILQPEDHSYKIVDGHHRLVRRYRGGVRVMDFYTAMPSVWEHCLLPATPEEEEQIKAILPPRVVDGTSITSRVLHKTR